MIKFRMRDIYIPVAVSSLLQSLEAKAANVAKAAAKVRAAKLTNTTGALNGR